MTRDPKAIDQLMDTLFINDARGYSGVDGKLWEAEGKRAITKQIALLDEKKHPGIKDKKLYQLQSLGDFHKLPKEEKEQFVRLSQQKALPVAEVYTSGAARN